MAVLRAHADLYGKQVFHCTNIAVYLYCYMDGIRCSLIIILIILLSISVMRPSQAHLVQVAPNHFRALQVMTSVLVPCHLLGAVSRRILIYSNSKSTFKLIIK